MYLKLTTIGKHGRSPILVAFRRLFNSIFHDLLISIMLLLYIHAFFNFFCRYHRGRLYNIANRLVGGHGMIRLNRIIFSASITAAAVVFVLLFAPGAALSQAFDKTTVRFPFLTAAILPTTFKFLNWKRKTRLFLYETKHKRER